MACLENSDAPAASNVEHGSRAPPCLLPLHLRPRAVLGGEKNQEWDKGDPGGRV